MKTIFSPQQGKLLSNYRKNVLIQLIAACAIGFILAYAMYIIVLVLSPEQKILVNGKLQTVSYTNTVATAIGMQPFAQFLHKPWMALTYAWAHPNFLSLLSNMLWLYCFGSVIQSLIGYKEIIPLFIFAYLFSGLATLGITAAAPQYFIGSMVTGALPATFAFAIAAITLAPKFKFYFSESFSIPLWVFLTLFLLLNATTFASGHANMLLALCSSGMLFGFVYMLLLKKGYRPGNRFYSFGTQLQKWITPAEYNSNKQLQQNDKRLNQSKETPTVDSILDKINQKGYHTLTAEEKDILLKASNES